MTKKHISLAFVAVAALLTGCTKTPVEESGKSGKQTYLELAHVGANQTKAALDGTTFPQDGHIGLFLFKEEAATNLYADGCANVDYSYSSQKGKWTADPPITVGGETGYLYGYYPYDSEATDVKAIPVESSLNGDDVMYASKQAEPITDATAANTAITMNHALARVSITIKNNGYTGGAKLSNIKFYGAEIAPTGTLNAIDGKITAEKDEVSLDVTGDAQTITAAGTTYECLLVPSDDISSRQDVTITFTIDDIAKEATLSGDDNGVIFAKGTKSNIAITLSNKGISVQTVSVEDWNVVEVGGHKVTVKLADDVTPHDILTEAYVDGNNVIIKANSFQGAKLICNVGDNAKCDRTITNGKYIFIISEICSDIEAVLGYDPIVTLTVSSDSYGSVWIGDDMNKTSGQYEIGAQVVIHASPELKFIFYEWNDNNKESSRTITVGGADVTYSASFIPKDVIPSLFTVDSKGKQVFFSKGNLYCSGVEFNDDGSVKPTANAQWGFEANQYDTTPSSDGGRVENHISHFMWCNSTEKAMALWYYNVWNGEIPFFAAKNFTVNGFSGWSVLTGGEGGEWEYLLDKRNTAYGENRRYAAVKVNGMAGLLIFPDNFSSWPSGAGDEPQTFNTQSNNWNGKNYTAAEFTVLQDNGCVFLPAAGSRSGNDGNASVIIVGNDGYYWSASPILDNLAYVLDFNSGNVDPDKPRRSK